MRMFHYPLSFLTGSHNNVAGFQDKSLILLRLDDVAGYLPLVAWTIGAVITSGDNTGPASAAVVLAQQLADETFDEQAAAFKEPDVVTVDILSTADHAVDAGMAGTISKHSKREWRLTRRG